VIRRGFWLAVGAAAGVAGYRRLTRLTRLARGLGPAVPPDGAVRGGQPRPAGRPLLPRALEFARDVRDGSREYLNRHPGGPAHTLGSQRANQARRPDHAKDGQ
jgi:hypothetical protein